MDKPAALAHTAIYDTVVKALRVEPRGKMLDVPAGHGALATRLIDEGFDVACCDLYPQLFALDGVPIDGGDLDAKLPYQDGSFELAVCVEGLEHIQNPTNAVRELSRVLATEGVLIVSVPNIMNIEERLKWVIYGYTSHFKPLSSEALSKVRAEFPDTEEVALHVNPIGYSEIRYILEKYGFTIEQVLVDKPKSNGWAYWPIAAVIKLFGRMSSKQRRRERWTDELNSNAVLMGGNTLIFKARKT